MMRHRQMSTRPGLLTTILFLSTNALLVETIAPRPPTSEAATSQYAGHRLVSCSDLRSLPRCARTGHQCRRILRALVPMTFREAVLVIVFTTGRQHIKDGHHAPVLRTARVGG